MSVNVNANIKGAGVYLVMYLDSAGVLRLANSVWPANASPIPITAEITGAGSDVTIICDANGNYTATLDVASDNSAGAYFFGAAYGNARSISINYTTGVVTAGASSDTLTAIMSRSGANAAETVAFLARTTGLDATHTAAYTALINGLVADGVFAKFDVLHVYATQNAATAQLNLVSASYPATLTGSPTFTADRGYAGVEGNTTPFISTGFNPTLSSPKYARDSAHISAWSLLNTGNSDHSPIGWTNTSESRIMPKAVDGSSYYRINGSNIAGIANAGTVVGHFIANRSSSTAVQGYKNGVSDLTNNAAASLAVENGVFYTTAYNGNGTSQGVAQQVAAASIGSSLSAGDALAFYNRLSTYLLALSNPGAEATAFLARTSGLDTTHKLAYTDLINGLVTDNIWTKLDVFHVYATQNQATAQLNLVSSSFPATLNGAVTFTADRGFAGVTSSTTIYIDTGFNPSSAPSPKYVLNSAHISAWGLINAQQPVEVIGVKGVSVINPRFSDDNCYNAVNHTAGQAFSSLNATGHFLANRSGASAFQAYRNATQNVNNATAVVGLPNLNMYAAGVNNAGTPNGSAWQESMISIGSSLSSTDVTNFYNRLRTYMTAVGVP